MNSIIIIGAGGFGSEALWLCRRIGLPVTGFCDDAEDRQHGHLDDLPLLGSPEEVAKRMPGPHGFHCAVGDNRARQALTRRAQALGWQPITLIDSAACCAPDVQIGAGSYIGMGSIVSCRARLGQGTVVNLQATVGHDCLLGDFAQVCPGARLSGACRMGEGALVGSNGVLIPSRSLGAWSILGAGAVAMRDVPDGESIVRVR